MEKQVKLNDKTFRLYKSESEILSAVRNIAPSEDRTGVIEKFLKAVSHFETIREVFNQHMCSRKNRRIA